MTPAISQFSLLFKLKSWTNAREHTRDNSRAWRFGFFCHREKMTQCDKMKMRRKFWNLFCGGAVCCLCNVCPSPFLSQWELGLFKHILKSGAWAKKSSWGALRWHSYSITRGFSWWIRCGRDPNVLAHTHFPSDVIFTRRMRANITCLLEVITSLDLNPM